MLQRFGTSAPLPLPLQAREQQVAALKAQLTKVVEEVRALASPAALPSSSPPSLGLLGPAPPAAGLLIMSSVGPL